MKFKKILIAIIIVIIALLVSGRWILKNYMFPYKYSEAVNTYSKEYKLDPLFVLSLMKAESKFNPKAKSNRDAIGLMQITPSTGIWIAEQMGNKNFNVDDLYDINTNIQMGCWYLNNLSKEFNGNRDLIISAYNAGRGNVNKWLKNSEYSKDGKNIHTIPFKETKNYLDKINLYEKIYNILYR
ncbi:lytic transglycosylase domain-containing protein [uncultured Clostridium sp.]|uniref:lytic transglycosylase domain-containing protein n=1 Tax=uncultured Clostridium sp. TaxID=59620 RepID=UPI002605BA26|nr:lytic transglycosylase domain-containing protein [uncultured Clostridium sp.]